MVICDQELESPEDDAVLIARADALVALACGAGGASQLVDRGEIRLGRTRLEGQGAQAVRVLSGYLRGGIAAGCYTDVLAGQDE